MMQNTDGSYQPDIPRNMMDYQNQLNVTTTPKFSNIQYYYPYGYQFYPQPDKCPSCGKCLYCGK